MTAPWKLPTGWHWQAFKDVATVASNLVDPRYYPDHPHLAPNHIVPESGRHESLRTVSADGVTSSKHLFKPGQIIYSKIRPYLRKATLAEGEGLCSADMYPIETDLESRYLMWWMLSGEFTRLALKGRSVIPKINQRELNALPVPVPAQDEQREIVEAIERTLSIVDAGCSAVDDARKRLRQFESALEGAAIYGRLAPHQGDRTASLEAVVSCRDSRAAEEVLGSPPQDVTIPDHWSWSSVDALADVQSGAAKSKRLQQADGCVERPYLSVANVQRGRLDLTEVKSMWVRESKLDDLALRPGDVLFNEGGDKDKLGRGCVWEGQIDGCVHQNHVFRARLRGDGVDPRWLSHWGNVFGRWWFHERGSQTTGIASINKMVLRSLPVPVPPPAEQQDILKELDRQRTAAQHLQTTIDAATSKSATVRRAILKAAFEGRLTSNARDPQSFDLQEAIA